MLFSGCWDNFDRRWKKVEQLKNADTDTITLKEEDHGTTDQPEA